MKVLIECMMDASLIIYRTSKLYNDMKKFEVCLFVLNLSALFDILKLKSLSLADEISTIIFSIKIIIISRLMKFFIGDNF